MTGMGFREVESMLFGIGLGVGHVVQVVVRSFQQFHQVRGRARLEPIIAEPHILEGIQQAERVINTRATGHEMITVVPFP